MSDRFDIVLVGIDPARPRTEVIAGLAQRLLRPSEEIEQWLERAPSTVAAALPSTDAHKLVDELRKLGARVKPQPTTEIAPDAPPAKIELSYWSADEDGYERPAERVEDHATATAMPNALELRDEIDASVPTGPAALVLEAVAPSAAKHGRAERIAPERPERPRVFVRALPAAFALPFGRGVREPLAQASLLGVACVALGAAGLRLDVPWGPMLVAFATIAGVGYAGLVLQLAHLCFRALARAERMPGALPSRLMDDYLVPGVGVVLALVTLGATTTFVIADLRMRDAPAWCLASIAIASGSYAALGMIVSTASASARGFVSVARIVSLVARAPLRIGLVVAIGAGAITAWGGATATLIAAQRAHAMLTVVVDVAAIAAPLVVVASYCVIASAGALGLLSYAEPELLA
jgi:hypothetical protein